MAESKNPQAIALDNLPNKKGDSGNSPLGLFQNPDALYATPRFAPLFFAFNIVLLALTAVVFQKEVFSTAILDSDKPLACSSNCTAGDARCQAVIGECLTSGTCYYPPASDGAACAGADFTCWNGQCLSSTDPCYGKLCRAPVDDRCVASASNGSSPLDGTCVNGECQYQLLPDNTRCPAVRGDSENLIALKGWTCQKGICTSPTQNAVADYAYSASIQAGIIGSALALEIYFTGDFTPDLAALAINSGLIVIGWDGFFVDTGLEADTGVGRTQVAFGFIAGGFAIIFGNWLLSTKSKADISIKNRIVAYVLIGLWLVTFGLVSQMLAQTFENFDQGRLDDNANITYFWAYQATIFAASVNIAVAHSLLRTDSCSSGFAAFSAITAIIALAWASQHQDKEGGEKNHNDFTETALAWQSLAIISGSISLVIGLFLTVTQKPNRSNDDKEVKVSRLFALVIVVVFCTLIGIVAALFTKHYFERREDVYGVDPRVVGGENSLNYMTNNWANQVSPFAWDFSIWASAVAASFGVELLIHGGGSAGLAALAFTQTANLVGWAGKHSNVGNVRPAFDELKGTTEAWEGIALTAGIICALFALTLIRRQGKQSDASKPAGQSQPDAGARSLEADDRELFATEGNNQQQGRN